MYFWNPQFTKALIPSVNQTLRNLEVDHLDWWFQILNSYQQVSRVPYFYHCFIIKITIINSTLFRLPKWADLELFLDSNQQQYFQYYPLHFHDAQCKVTHRDYGYEAIKDEHDHPCEGCHADENDHGGHDHAHRAPNDHDGHVTRDHEHLKMSIKSIPIFKIATNLSLKPLTFCFSAFENLKK